MQIIWRSLKYLLIVALLTLFTQTGGLIFLACWPILNTINKKVSHKWKRFFFKITAYSAVYLMVNLLLLPPLAKMESGRVPLRIWGNDFLKPHQAFYFSILNHHYVRPEVKASCERVAAQMAEKFPGSKLYYLDANFPFFDGYPLHPHFSHRNGITVDVALYWQETATAKPLDGAPFPLAYGVSEEPHPGEVDMEDKCGNPFRSIEMRWTKKIVDMDKYQLDEERTAAMIKYFLKEKSVCKILLEPHLKSRLGLSKENKVRFQGCKAARHDDHIHVIWCN